MRLYNNTQFTSPKPKKVPQQPYSGGIQQPSSLRGVQPQTTAVPASPNHYNKRVSHIPAPGKRITPDRKAQPKKEEIQQQQPEKHPYFVEPQQEETYPQQQQQEGEIKRQQQEEDSHQREEDTKLHQEQHQEGEHQDQQQQQKQELYRGEEEETERFDPATREGRSQRESRQEVSSTSTSSPSIANALDNSLQSASHSFDPPTSTAPPYEDDEDDNNTLEEDEAAAMRREGAEATISRLRTELEKVTNQDAAAKTSLAKSEAMILELRSAVRQLKRQVEMYQVEKEQAEEEKEEAIKQLNAVRKAGNDGNATAQSMDARIGELQVQLDRAHAQILTADMVRKELEDTLEAEQYTWDLRVQEQERTIRDWQDQCRTLQQDLDQTRSQWRDAEDGWTKEVAELQNKLEKAQQEANHWKSMQGTSSNSSNEIMQLKERLLVLEQERSELQGCLDDALKELEAVDAELQNDNSIQLREENERLQQLLEEKEREAKDSALLEPLQHLYRWLLEREENEYEDEGKSHVIPNNSLEIIERIQDHLEDMPTSVQDLTATKKQVQALESQLSVYRGDLKAREESSAELMASLKEAVSLLKPLQDAAAKADRERSKLMEQLEKAKAGNDTNSEQMKRLREHLNEKEDEIEELKEKVESLELELSREKLAAANSIISQSKSVATPSPDSAVKTRSKRQSEETLQKLLRDTQSKYSTLRREANDSLNAQPSESVDDDSITGTTQKMSAQHQQILENKEALIKELQEEALMYEKDISDRDSKIQSMEKEVATLKERLALAENSGDPEKLKIAEARIEQLEADLHKSKMTVHRKRESEKKLKGSLQEALNLVKPLQRHLVESEQEKKDLEREIEILKQQNSTDESVSRTVSSAAQVRADQVHALENTVKQLEKENSQLHDALEDMSQSLNASHISAYSGVSSSQPAKNGAKTDSRLREELVELKSRYEVTQGRLEDSFVENHTLVEALQKKQRQADGMQSEIDRLREKLQSTERELDNAKYIATSALVKVEELTMSNVESMSLNNSVDQEHMYQEKASELDREMGKLRNQPRQKTLYRLS